MSEKVHNCNLCKNTKLFSKIGNVCFGKKHRGKIISEDDAICEEYEFGGFIELSEKLKKIPEVQLKLNTSKIVRKD